MPYKSEKQRSYLHAKEPELAAKWDKKYGSKPKPSKKRKKRKSKSSLYVPPSPRWYQRCLTRSTSASWRKTARR